MKLVKDFGNEMASLAEVGDRFVFVKHVNDVYKFDILAVDSKEVNPWKESEGFVSMFSSVGGDTSALFTPADIKEKYKYFERYKEFLSELDLPVNTGVDEVEPSVRVRGK